MIPRNISRFTGRWLIPQHLINYFKYPVIIDGQLFANTFNFQCQHSLERIFAEYRQMKG